MLTIDDIKHIQLEELKFIDKLCRENNIEYSLSYGSLIGAIRHHGFIPWDDDIDIMLRRDDYNKLLALLNIYCKNRYKLLTYKTNWFTWAKLCDAKTYVVEDIDFNIQDYGVWLDIFPVDKVPKPNSVLGKIHRFLVRITKRVSQARAVSVEYAKSLHGLKRILWLLRHKILEVFPISFYSKIANYILLKYHDVNTGYVAECNFYWNSNKLSFLAEVFDSYKDVTFENFNARIICEYDLFLKSVYGDYMQLPPIDKQKSNHSYRAFYK